MENNNQKIDANKTSLAQKQSAAKPAAENLDMEPNSVERDHSPTAKQSISNIDQHADNYAKKEHQKAAKWQHSDIDKKEENL